MKCKSLLLFNLTQARPLLYHLIFIRVLEGLWYHTHFSDAKTELQRGYIHPLVSNFWPGLRYYLSLCSLASESNSLHFVQGPT